MFPGGRGASSEYFLFHFLFFNNSPIMTFESASRREGGKFVSGDPLSNVLKKSLLFIGEKLKNKNLSPHAKALPRHSHHTV
jgi:hypothetical protein